MEYTMISLLFATILLKSCVQALTIEGWTWSHKMDSEERYQLRTNVDLAQKFITFSINLADIAPYEWIGIGLVSKSGMLNNADLVIAVKNPEENMIHDFGGEYNMTDYFTNGTGVLWEDNHDQYENLTDWNQVENNGTWFSVERSFQVENATQDWEIKNENIFLVWAYGNETDDDGVADLNGISTTKGYFQVNLLQYPTSSAGGIFANLDFFIPMTAIVLFASIKNIFVN